MNAKQRALGARLVLVLTLAVALVVLLRIDYEERLASDIFALVKRDAPVDGAATEMFEEVIERQGRVLAILIEGDGTEETAAGAVKLLSASPAIERATLMEEGALNDFGRALFEERMVLLFPRFLKEARAEHSEGEFEDWLAGRTVERINETLVSPEGLALAELLPDDPLLLLADAVEEITGNGAAGSGSIVLATIAGAPTDAEIQEEVAFLLERIRQDAGQAEVLATGAVLFAAESEARIRAEVFKLNLLMGGAVVAAVWILIGSLRGILLLIAPVLMGAISAIALTLGTADTVHVLTFALAGIIGGAAVDYPLHILLHRRDGDRDYLGSVRRVWRPLALGCTTTALVFLFLMFSDLSLVRHTGMMVGSGLIIAGLMAVLVFTGFGPAKALRVRARKPLNHRFRTSKRTLVVALGVFVLCTTGLPLLEWNDSIEALEMPLPELQAQDERVRERGGLGGDRQLLISTGATFGEAMAKAAAIPREAVVSGPVDWVATPTELEAAAVWLEQNMDKFSVGLGEKLEAGGFDSAAFEPFFAALREPLSQERYEDALEQLFANAPAGMDQLAGVGRDGAWVLTGVDAEGSFEIPEGSLSLDARKFLEEAFRQYRLEAKQYAAAGFAVAALVIVLGVGLRDGLLILAAPGVAVLAALGILGFTGAEGSLFHVVGMLLGFGLGLDYAVFRVRGHDALASVRLSAITTLAAFGVLSTSAIPAVGSLGTTVFLVVGIALVICEAMPQPNGQVARENTTPGASPTD